MGQKTVITTGLEVVSVVYADALHSVPEQTSQTECNATQVDV
jgi:hypothetical protein